MSIPSRSAPPSAGGASSVGRIPLARPVAGPQRPVVQRRVLVERRRRDLADDGASAVEDAQRRRRSVTRPTTWARTSQRRHSARTSSRSAGSTTASIRSWLSDVMISNGSRPGWRRATAETSTSMPTPPRLAISLVAQQSPAPPRSWIADDEAGVEQREAGLDQPLLLERVTDLHVGPLGRVGVGIPEAGGGQHRHAADPVAARCSTRAARPGCRRPWPGRAPAGRPAAARGTAR